ncbi:hydrogen peroxide-inducible genes activator [Spongiibacter taiwanensis]|uniref:hydrogen peroxide-inducible genes activator n=1 Tax=Spongiibacter taiwanensis TaxID=1748242 RepID=UPI0020353037|nr:hydrogen peroxide-inducible genes activator [Spongiibacter taiwanensis]USA42898.1 hydrogen peroxide-inducible genes activator [Spongiibacter taiwanensis]
MARKMPSIAQIRYFVSVADLANYRKAADELGISQPALTTQISAMETTLGVALFERSRAGTQLSPAGRELLPAARQILLSMQGFQEQANMLSSGHQATYKLGIPPTVGPYLLPHVLPDLHQKHQDLKLHVREAAHRILLNELEKGSYDLVLVPLPLPVSLSHFSIEPLFTESLKFVVPSDHRFAGTERITPAKLRGEKVLTLEEQHHFHQQIQEICEKSGAIIQPDYAGTSLDTLRQMVVMGMGVAFLPALYVHSELHHPKALHVCELQNNPITRQHGLVWRSAAPNRVFYRRIAADIRDIIKRRLGKVQGIESS